MPKRLLQIIFVLIIIESIIVIGQLIPWDLVDISAPFQGLSAINIGLVLILMVIILGCTSILINKRLQIGLINKLQKFFEGQRTYKNLISILLILIAYEALQDVLFLRSPVAAVHYEGYRQILGKYFSLLVWLFLVSLELLAAIYIIIGIDLKKWASKNRRELILFIIAGAFLGLLHLSRAGYHPSYFEFEWFEELNAPLMGVQVSIIIILLVGFLALANKYFSKREIISTARSDYTIVFLLILVAFIAWSRVPNKASSFVDIPRPPNFQYYPRSDALGYEISAHRLLAGNGTGRTIHVGFWQYLAFKNLIIGDNFQAGVRFNLLVLSIIPALLYLAIKSFQDRLSGLLVSVLFIIREVNGLRLVEYITIQQIRDQLTEPFVILGVSLVLLILVKWNNASTRPAILLLLAGGILGWIILLRVEALVYIPAIGLGVLFILRKNFFCGVKSIALIMVGILLVSGPWMYRGVRSSGSLLSIGMGRERLVLDSMNQLIPNNNKQVEEASVEKHQEILFNIGNNLISFLYYLPANHQPLLTINNLPDLMTNQVDPTDLEGDTYREKYLERYARSLPYWWNDWDGKLESRSFLPLLFSVFLILLGFFQITDKNRGIVLIIALVAIFHTGIYSFIGRSGGRFLRSVDWISLVFYGIGLSVIIKNTINSNHEVINNWWWNDQTSVIIQNTVDFRKSKLGMVLTSAALFMFGLSFPLAESAIPKKFNEEKKLMAVDVISSVSKNDLNMDECIELKNSGYLVEYGKALFPRYFEADRILEDVPGRNFTDPDENRIEFYLVGTKNIWVAIPNNRALRDFPNGSEVIILGDIKSTEYFRRGQTDNRDYFSAKCLIFSTDDLINEPVELTCVGDVCK